MLLFFLLTAIALLYLFSVEQEQDKELVGNLKAYF